jgi:hypothetical protein
MSADWTASEARADLEHAFAKLGGSVRTELLGTLLADETTLWVVVRCRSTGALHRIRHDLAELRTEAAATTLSRVTDELLFRSTNLEDLTPRGTDNFGLRTWT